MTFIFHLRLRLENEIVCMEYAVANSCTTIIPSCNIPPFNSSLFNVCDELSLNFITDLTRFSTGNWQGFQLGRDFTLIALYITRRPVCLVCCMPVNFLFSQTLVQLFHSRQLFYENLRPSPVFHILGKIPALRGFS